jgi:hypothetical protein
VLVSVDYSLPAVEALVLAVDLDFPDFVVAGVKLLFGMNRAGEGKML